VDTKNITTTKSQELKATSSLGYSVDSIVAFFSKKVLMNEKVESPNKIKQKVIKLTVMAQGYYLGYFGKKLFNDPVFAFKYGPVVKINNEIAYQGISPDMQEINNTHNELDLLNRVWEAYGGKTGIELSALLSSDNHFWIHHWDYAIQRASEIKNISKDEIDKITIIPDSYIENFYRHLIHDWSK
jgi:uncharacterized phage-associated protein